MAQTSAGGPGASGGAAQPGSPHLPGRPHPQSPSHLPAPPRPRHRAAVLVVALLAALLGAADTAHAAAGYTVLQLNICNSGFSCTVPDTARRAGELVAARRPAVVTVNEVCASDLAAIRALTGYDGVFAQSGDQTCRDASEGSAGSPYGNAVLFPPGTAMSGYRFVEYREQNQATERRTLACATGDGVTACVTHLTCDTSVPALRDEDLGVRLGQAAEMRAVVGDLARHGSTVLAGDWNLPAADARGYVPDGMAGTDDGSVQHVAATSADFRIAHTSVLPLDWTDHPALLVGYTRVDRPLGGSSEVVLARAEQFVGVPLSRPRSGRPSPR
ncbi:MAG: endonuclease/exonuclease/phosphatase family protein [Pseudonocardia sp.]